MEAYSTLTKRVACPTLCLLFQSALIPAHSCTMLNALLHNPCADRNICFTVCEEVKFALLVVGIVRIISERA